MNSISCINFMPRLVILTKYNVKDLNKRPCDIRGQSEFEWSVCSLRVHCNRHLATEPCGCKSVTKGMVGLSALLALLLLGQVCV